MLVSAFKRTEAASKTAIYLEQHEGGSCEAEGQMECCSKFPEDFSWKQDTDHWLPTDLCVPYTGQPSRAKNLIHLMFVPQNK